MSNNIEPAERALTVRRLVRGWGSLLIAGMVGLGLFTAHPHIDLPFFLVVNGAVAAVWCALTWILRLKDHQEPAEEPEANG